MKKINFCIIVFGLLLGCVNQKKVSQPSSFKEIINLYSSDHLSVKSPVVVQFVADSVRHKKRHLSSDFFTITPEVKGELKWESDNTVKFIPKESLAPDTKYEVSVMVSDVLPKVADSLEVFTFSFTTKKQHFDFGTNYLKPVGNEYFTLYGYLNSSDYVEQEELEKMIRADLGDEQLSITWDVDNYYSKTKHGYSIDSIPRNVDQEVLELSFANNQSEDRKEINIPALGDFKLVDVKLLQDNKQQIKLLFSDVIDPDQSLEGLVRVDRSDYKVSVNENYALITFDKYITGEVNVSVERGILNLKKHKLQESKTEVVTFKSILPGVRRVIDQTILPYGEIMPFTIETVNLSAVDVRVTKILQQNVLQFLQRNDLNGADRVNYVGEQILTKKVVLSKSQNQNLWRKQVINLKSMIAKDPKALYHIEVGFRKSYSTYPCKENSSSVNDPSTLGIYDDVVITEKNFWEQHDKRDNYNWSQRNNPCHDMFYSRYADHSNSSMWSNILGSDLGVIVKEEKSGDLVVAVTSILTTDPLENVKIDLYNFQGRKLKSVVTNSEGIASIKYVGAYFVVASYGNQRGYLKLKNSEALSISSFDVGGSSTSDDIKGLLYAERGVWRPGDSIFVNLMIEDKYNNFPEGYPVGFEFTNPRGQIVERRTVTKGLNGHYTFWTKTELGAMTGDYLVRAFVGDRTYRKDIKVEAVRPNRLKIKMDIGEEKVLFADSSFQVNIDTKWLHGGNGVELRHKIDAVLHESYTSFDGYSNYSFKAPYRKFESMNYVFLDEYTDENGIISTTESINRINNPPGFVKANFKVKAFEKGGRFSVDKTSKLISPYTDYVGVKSTDNYVKINDVVDFDFVNLDRNGKASDDSLILTLYKLEYNWWYNVDNEKYVYQGELMKNAVKKDTLVTSKGKADFQMVFGEQYDYGRYLLLAKNSAGHMTGKMIYFNKYTYESVGETSGTKKLSLKSDKSVYKVGEEVKLTIPTAGTGRVFLSLENGQEIISTKWVKATDKTTTYSFTATDKFSPYVYAHAIYLQPHDHANDLPVRMYGVIPIKIESKNTHLAPVISMKEELRPNKSFEIKISESKKLPMTYTLAIVDEGLLDITHYKMPEIWKTFNRRAALEVKTFDIYDRVIEATRFNVKNLLSLGGDGSEAPPEGVKLNRFKPMVKFIGPFYCDAGETVTHKLDMPNYIGSVKVMVVAGHNGAYGKTSKKVKIKEPLMILGTLPRVLGPGEEVRLPIDVFTMKDNIRDVKVSIETNDLMEILGADKEQLHFDKMGEQQLFFELKTKEKFGRAKVKLTAESNGLKSTYTVELNVRAPNANFTTSKHEIVPANAVYQTKVKSYGYKGTNDVTAELSSIPSINLKKRLGYLLRYPYGCVEQTTSSVFPQLHLTTLMEIEVTQKREIEQNIKAGIKRLKRFQTSDGGFSYWPGGGSSHEWGTNYAGEFILEAKEKGFYVEEKFLKKWIDYQTKKAKRWSGSNGQDQTQAYRLYLLAKAGKPNLGAMNRLRLNGKEKQFSNWYLASAYALIGQSEIAEELIKPLPESKSYDYYYSFGSSERDKAIKMMILTEIGKYDRAWVLAKELADKLNSNHYMSTQSTAYSLLAISKYVQGNAEDSQMSFELDMLGSQKVKTDKSIWQDTKSYEDSLNVVVRNHSSLPLFLNVIQNGIPNNKKVINEELGLNLEVTYLDEDNYEIDPKSLKQGEDFIAQVTVENTSDKYYRHMGMTQVFPSGWEIHNNKMDNTSTWTNNVNYEEIKDDRVNLFYNLGPGRKKTFKVFLNASYVGKYFLPAIQTEAMYDHEIRARKSGFWVEVVK